MPDNIFFTVLKMNIASGLTAAAVLFLRAALKRLGCPKRIVFLLWAAVALRLIFPVFPENGLSVFNLAKTVGAEKAAEENAAEEFRSAIYKGGKIMPDIGGKATCAKYDFSAAAAYIWIFGAGIILFLRAAAYLKLKKRLRFAVKTQNGIYETEYAETPFVFGIFKPKIYIPAGKNKEYAEITAAHERAHIGRGDFLTKPLACILLSVHWFNPLNIILFRIFSDDMEQCCDEEAIKLLGEGRRKEYAAALLESSSDSAERFSCVSLAFSKNKVLKRINNILRRRKEPLPSAVFGVFICIFALFALCTDKTADAKRAAEIFSFPEKAAAAPVYKTEEIAETTAEKVLNEQAPEKEETEKQTAEVLNETAEPLVLETETKKPDPVIGEYTYKNGCESVSKGISCDGGGNITLTFSLNTETTAHVEICESETAEETFSGTLPLRDGESAVFSDLNPEKRYDIYIRGTTGSEWKIEGFYRIN